MWTKTLLKNIEAGIVLARDPPTRHLGRVFGHFDRFGWSGQSLKSS